MLNTLPMFDYTINWLLFVARLLPTLMRGRNQTMWLFALIAPSIRVHNLFIEFKDKTLYDADINGQVVKLERMLNDKFDSTQKRIFITDGEFFDGVNAYSFYLDKSPGAYSFGHDEMVSLYSYSLLGDAQDVDFIVHVPVTLAFDEILMNAMLKNKKILGPSYKIETF